MSTRSETTRRLRDAARAAVIADGIGGCRIDRICKRAGLTRGAFYSNYSNLEELLSATLSEHLTVLTNRALSLDAEWVETITRFTPELYALDGPEKIAALLLNVAVATGLTGEAELINMEILTAAAHGWMPTLPLDAMRDALTHVGRVVLTAAGRTPTTDDDTLGIILMRLAPRDALNANLATTLFMALSEPD